MSDPPGTAGDTYGLMEGPLTSDPREKKKHFILDEIDTHLDHLEQEEKHSLWQNFWFFVMVSLCVAGVACIFVGLSLTVMFEQFDNNIPVFLAGCGLCSSFFVWLIYICCPGRRESERRAVMVSRRKHRRAQQTKKVYTIEDVESTLDEHAYKAGIIPFEVTEKDKHDGHHDRRGVSKMYLGLGKVVADDIDL